MNSYRCPKCKHWNDVNLKGSEEYSHCVSCGMPLNATANPLEDNDVLSFLGAAEPDASWSLDDLGDMDPFSQSDDANISFNPATPTAFPLAFPLGVQNQAAAGVAARAAKSSQPQRVASGPERSSNTRTVLLIFGAIAATLLMLVAFTAIVYTFSNTSSKRTAFGKQFGKPVKLDEVLGVSDLPNLELDGYYKNREPLLLDTPLPDVTVAPYVRKFNPNPEKLVFTASVEDISFHDRQPLIASRLPPIDFATAEGPDLAGVDEPLPADPIPADRNYTIASDLDIELPRWDGDEGKRDKERPRKPGEPSEYFPPLREFAKFNPQALPILACQNGPYVALVPKLAEAPFGWKVTNLNNRLKEIKPPQPNALVADGYQYEVLDRASEPVSVVDLRTGQTVGGFSPRVPFWLTPVLSPDGKLLVGPSSEAPRITERNAIVVQKSEEWDRRRNGLYIWKRDSNDEPTSIHVEGSIRCISFATDRALVLLVEGNERRVEVWDALSCKRVRSITLDSKFEYTRSGAWQHGRYVESPPSGKPEMALSGGGRYAAIAGPSGVHLLSLHEGKVIRTIQFKLDAKTLAPIPPDLKRLISYNELNFDFTKINSETFFCLYFVPSGDQLVVLLRNANHESNSGLSTQWHYDLTRGQTIRQEMIITKTNECVFDTHGLVSAFSIPFSSPSRQTQFRVECCDFSSSKVSVLPNVSKIFKIPLAGPVLGLRTTEANTYRVQAIPREALFASDPANDTLPHVQILEKNEYQHPDCRAMRRTVPNPPEKYSALPKIVFPPPFFAKSIPGAPAAWSNDKALVLFETTGNNAPGAIIDLMKEKHPKIPASLQDQPPVFSDPRYHFSIAHEGLGWSFDNPKVSAALSLSNKYYAIAWPAQNGVVTVYNATSNLKHCVIETRQIGAQPIVWTGFDREDNLLTLENGALSSWQIGADGASVIGRYSLHGQYTLPARLTPDRKTLFIASSGGEDIDAIDLATGNCLARFRHSGSTYASDLSFSPDGLNLSVLYSDIPRQQRVKHHPPRQTFSAAVWNLSNGTLRATGLIPQHRGDCKAIGWVTPKHLIFCFSRPLVYDLSRDHPVISYSISGTGLVRSHDDRIWIGGNPIMLSSLLSSSSQEENDILFNEAIFNFSNIPVQLVLNLGDKATNQKYAGELLETLQQQGWKIGPSKYSWYVTAQIRNTDMEVTFDDGRKFRVPSIQYHWVLVENGKRAISDFGSSTHFNPEKSKYFTGKKNKPLLLPRNKPTAAIVNELLEKREGMARCSLDAREPFVVRNKIRVRMPVPFEITRSADAGTPN